MEKVILANLIENEKYCRKVLPYLKSEYFHDLKFKIIFDLTSKYVEKYNTLPSKTALKIDLSNITTISEEEFKRVEQIVDDLQLDKVAQDEWLLGETEKFCQDKAIYNAIMESIKVLDGKNSKLGKGSIPALLEDALAVSFDTNIGMDYIEDWERRYDLLHSKEARVPFSISIFNKITKNGLLPKTLNIILAGIHVGKTLMMCNFAASNYMDGKNVLYITMEMSEEQIQQRIDAALLDITLDDLEIIPKDVFKKKIDRIKAKTIGKLITKEYPTSGASAANFRHLLHELRQKDKFVPDIIFIDYLNICQSFKHKNNSNVNSYEMIKSVAQELRALAVEFNLPIFSATQTTREGLGSSDIGMSNTSESIALPGLADFMFAAIRTDELDKLNQLLIKQLKNRYNGTSKYNSFVVGINIEKMQMYEVENSAQNDIIQPSAIPNPEKKFDKSKLKDFS